MKKKPNGRKLPPARQKELLRILKDRFEKNDARHPGLRWEAVQASRKEHKPKDGATGMAAAMGIELLTEEQYRELRV